MFQDWLEKKTSEDEAKEVHLTFKIAFGIFKHLKESHIPKLIILPQKREEN